MVEAANIPETSVRVYQTPRHDDTHSLLWDISLEKSALIRNFIICTILYV